MTGVFVISIITLIFGCAYGEVLLGEEYYKTLQKYIAQAQKSIIIGMYFIIMEDETSPVNNLVDSLIEAKKRGVEVTVVLEDAKLGESRQAFNILKENGIDVSADLPGKRMHLKGVIVDRRYVFLGSANWSRAAIEENYDATLFVDSESDAKALIEFIEDAKITHEERIDYEGVNIPVDFLLSPEKGRILLKTHAKRQLDLYLLLLKQYQETANPTFKIDEKALVEEMGYKVPKDLASYKTERTFYHDTIRKLLKSLKKGGFIDYDKDVVTLNIEPPDETQTPQNIVIPYEYWKYGYDKTLSMTAKYLYLICLYEAARSVRYPYWFHSQEDMAKLYGIHRFTISKGLRELEKLGILEVARSKARPPDFSRRKANVYKLLPLYPLNQSPKENK